MWWPRKEAKITEEIANIKCMKMSVKACIATLRKDADSLSIDCENEKDMKVVMQLVVKSNSFRKTAIEKEITTKKCNYKSQKIS